MQFSSPADAFTRNFKTNNNYGQVNSISIKESFVKDYNDLGFPRITRVRHQVKIIYLAYTLANSKKMRKSCQYVCVMKPKFYKQTP